MDFVTFKAKLLENNIILDDKQIESYGTYSKLLQEWNKVMDLTAIDDEAQIIEKHFYDSLISAKYFKYENQTLLDIGSGAGFPGLVLAIAFPSLKITLLEPTLKRCNFLNEVIKVLDLSNVKVVNDRAENYIKEKRESFDLVTSRAVSRLNMLLELSIPFLTIQGTMIALKGKNANLELKEAENALKILNVKLLKNYEFKLPSEEENRSILLLKKEARTNIKYPRNYGTIKRSHYKLLCVRARRLVMTKIIAIANQKGGVGKTTTAISLSAALANFNRRVLLLDMDPQGNSSRGFSIDITLINKSMYDVLVKDLDINKAIRKTVTKNVDILPANLKLASTDVEVSNKVSNPLFLLKNAIEKIHKNYDYIIIDCPPSLGLLNINSLVAANSVIIPVQCEYFAMEAVAQILSSISQIQSTYNSNLTIEGFLMTMYDPRARLCVEVSTQVRGLFKENTFITQIPRNISLPESSARGLPITMYRPTSAGSIAYLNLAKEILEHEQQER